jgi:hypothetical protein
MPKPVHLGDATLVGWRKVVADAVAPRAARRAPLTEEQARAVVGSVLFAASLFYVAGTIARMVRTARG